MYFIFYEYSRKRQKKKCEHANFFLDAVLINIIKRGGEAINSNKYNFKLIYSIVYFTRYKNMTFYTNEDHLPL